MLPSGLSTNLKHLQVSQNVNKTQYEYIQAPPRGRTCVSVCVCVHVNNVTWHRGCVVKNTDTTKIQTQAKILHYSSLNVRRFGHQIYLQTVDRLGFSVGELRTLWTGETIAVRSHHDSASNVARLPWICAHPPNRSTLAYGPVRVTTECHKNESARLHTYPPHDDVFVHGLSIRKNGLDKFPRTSTISDLHSIPEIISMDFSGLATDPPCSVWGRGWAIGLLHDGPLLGLGCWLSIGVKVWYGG